MESEPIVVIVEDDPISRLQLERALKSGANVSVTSFSDGESVVEFVDRNHINAALLDIGLPGIDGVETARRLKDRQDLEIVFINAHTDEDTLAAARNIDPYALLSKPIDTDRICKIVQKITDASNPRAGDALSPEFVLDTLYDTGQIGMCITDENRRFVRVNRGYRETYGFLSEELIGREFTTVLPEEDREHAATMHGRH